MSCVFSTSDPLRSAQRKNTPNPYAILIAVNQSNHKRSWTVKEKANCTIPGPKNPKTLQFSAKNCNRRQEILKQNDLRDTPKHTPNRVESPFNVHSTPKAAPATTKRPPCRTQPESGPEPTISPAATTDHLRDRRAVCSNSKRTVAALAPAGGGG